MTEITRRELDEAVEGQTIASRALQTFAEHPDRVALRWREGDGWGEMTWREYEQQVAVAAAGFQRLGVEPGDRVVLMVRNVPEFHIADLALVFLGATAVSIYNSSAPDQVAYLTAHSGAKLAVAGDAGFLARFEAVREDVPDLDTIVMLDDAVPADPASGVVSKAELLEGHEPADLAALASACSPDDPVTVIYTSGTTGPPKGALISHRNVVWTAEGLLRMIDIDPVGLRVVSYLPMAHIAERLCTHYLGVLGGLEVTTCPEPGRVAEYAREVHPEIMFGVPRVWEKIHAGVQAALAADPEKKASFDEAVAAAIPITERRSLGQATDEDLATWNFLDSVAFSQVRELVGLDAMKVAISGAAPIAGELISWFRALGVPLSEIYGMSESTALMAWEPYRVRAGTVGRAFAGTEMFLTEEGEVCIRGGNVFLGYLDDPEKTAETIDPDGTLHSGDIGTIDEEGYLTIIDRKKELIITAGGKNISPANLETALRQIPLVGQACAIGDQRPFVSALVVLDPDVAPAWAKEQGIDFDTLADLAQDPAVLAEIDRGLEEVMAEFNHAEQVKKVRVLAEEWLPDSEELTPTSKLKRRGIHQKYADEIAALYS
ncbi:MAG TPA: AMP-dependent synthetase/ligase [Acidimicrobiales bacterium]